MVTAAGIGWPIGRACAACCVMVAIGSGALWWLARLQRSVRLCAISAGLVAVGVVGAGYGFAVALRADSVGRHPITTAFGTSAPVTVSPTESPLSLAPGRLMFRATIQRLHDDEISGRVVVFARAAEYGELTVGQPVRFTAHIARPARHDLTVAVLTAVGRPAVGYANRLQRAAHMVRRQFALAVREVLPADQAAMLPALVLGDT
ncbi:competence protein, partial [Mycobacterium simiae]